MSDNGQEKQVLFEIKQLCKSFGPTKVLDHIDATIRQGEVVVIVGPSGSGKSTFLRSLNLLEMPTSGEILFEGKEITDGLLEILDDIESGKLPLEGCLLYTSPSPRDRG